MDVNPATKQTSWTSFKSDIYIHERQNQYSKLSSNHLNGLMAEPSEQSTDIQNFVISGIIDLKSGKKLSLTQAIARGIINIKSGTYVNPETGEVMSIPEAIAKGLISIEDAKALHNGSAGEDNEHNYLETKSVSVVGVIDPRSGEMISVTEALATGILDPDTGKRCAHDIVSILIIYRISKFEKQEKLC